MNAKYMLTIATITLSAGFLASRAAISAQDRYSLRVPNGLAFSEFRGYEGWQIISLSYNGGRMAAILGNPATVDAFKAGIPGNGNPFPNGAKIAKIHWDPAKNESAPGQPLVPKSLHDVDFMVKDSERFADGGGWGYAVFEYDTATATFRPGNLTDHPPQANDAKCGAACHTIAAKQDYVFTVYPNR
jgi:hypothetical protein